MDDFRAILDQLEGRELDYVQARSESKSDAQAYQTAGISKSTFYGWSAERREQLNEYADELRRQTVFKAQMALADAAENAARKMIALLSAESETVQLNAAKDILDRTAGKPRQSVDMTSDGQRIESAEDIREDILRQLSRITAAGESGGISGEPDDSAD